MHHPFPARGAATVRTVVLLVAIVVAMTAIGGFVYLQGASEGEPAMSEPNDAAPTDRGAVLSGMDGEGTEADPYVVTTDHELQAMSEDRTAHYVLGNDVDASGTAHWNDGDGFDPIGDTSSDEAGFGGSLDGDGHEVVGLTIDRPAESDVGLFGHLNPHAEVSSVTLADVHVVGDVRVGPIAAANAGSVSNSHATGSVVGVWSAGGLVGNNAGSVSSSHAAVNVTGEEENVGGLVGTNSGGVSESYATGDVEGYLAGGLVGINYQEVADSYATGSVTSSDTWSGGLVGGLVGANHGTVTTSYAAGSVFSDEFSGGVIGDGPIDIDVDDAYWDVETTGQPSSAGSSEENGLTTDQMHGSNAEGTMIGLDWNDTWATVTDDYPVLQWQLE